MNRNDRSPIGRFDQINRPEPSIANLGKGLGPGAASRPIQSGYAQISPTPVGTVTRTNDDKIRARQIADEAGRIATRVREAVTQSPDVFAGMNADTKSLLDAFDRYYTDKERAVVQEDASRQDVSNPEDYAYYDPRDDKIHFTARFMELSEFEKILTVIHEALHWKGSRIARIETGENLAANDGLEDDNAGDWTFENPVRMQFENDVDGAAMTLMAAIWPQLGLTPAEIRRERMQKRTGELFDLIIADQ